MSAPKNAVTVYDDSEPNWAKSKKGKQVLNMGVNCYCGWSGKLRDMLCDPESDETNGFWCPVCESSGWEWA
jgi:hypothetical protein